MIPYAVKDDAFWVLPEVDLSEYGSYVTEVVNGLRYVHPDTPRSCFSYAVLHNGEKHYQNHSPCSTCKNESSCFLWALPNKYERRKGKQIEFAVKFDSYLFRSENKEVPIEELKNMKNDTSLQVESEVEEKEDSK